MKLLKTLLLSALVLGAIPSHAAITIPGADGSDGPLTISTDTVIDLSQAVTAQWDANNSANAGRGVYDPAKWAVVFKYTEVTVAAGATVTFKNHASRAPVVWLVSGNVTINGTVRLDGDGSKNPPFINEPGPGGFRGGAGSTSSGMVPAAGFGPGGGHNRVDGYENLGGGGSYSELAFEGGPAYGNPSLVPLMGGSGGAGRTRPSNVPGDGLSSPGGGGGGAILIACASVLSLDGRLSADGGHGGTGIYEPNQERHWAAGGSGGGVRLIAAAISGDGNTTAVGGSGGLGNTGWKHGALGRIRVERVANGGNVQFTPDPSVVALPDGATAQLWLPENGPTVRVVSVGERPAPADPLAGFGAVGADVVLPQVTSTAVILETTNVEQASVVKVRVTPRINGDFTETNAGVDQIVSEDPLVIRWKAIVPVKDGYAAIQARVVRP